jgi:hypothetical protein
MPLQKFEITADVPSDLEPTGEFRVAALNVDSFIGDNGMICRGTPDRMCGPLTTIGPRIILRPAWQWPEWIKPGTWLAMDSDGVWSLSSQEPKADPCGTYWFVEKGVMAEVKTALVDFTPPPCTDWRQSLRQKPL